MNCGPEETQTPASLPGRRLDAAHLFPKQGFAVTAWALRPPYSLGHETASQRRRELLLPRA